MDGWIERCVDGEGERAEWIDRSWCAPSTTAQNGGALSHTLPSNTTNITITNISNHFIVMADTQAQPHDTKKRGRDNHAAASDDRHGSEVKRHRGPKGSKTRGVIPPHKGAFKVKHTRKHSTLIRYSVAGVLISCGRNFHAQTISEASSLFRKYIAEVYPELVPNKPDDAAAAVESDSDDDEDDHHHHHEHDAAATTTTPSELSVPINPESESSCPGVSLPPRERVITVVDTGTEGLVYVAFLDPRVDPNTVVLRVLEDVRAGKVELSYASRLLPVLATCAATPNEARSATERACRRFFETEAAQQPHDSDDTTATAKSKYAVIYRCTNNAIMKPEREHMIMHIAKQAPESRYAVDLKNPDLVLIGTIFKSVFALSIVPRYYELCKYNAQELLRKSSGPVPAAPASTDTPAASTSDSSEPSAANTPATAE